MQLLLSVCTFAYVYLKPLRYHRGDSVGVFSIYQQQ